MPRVPLAGISHIPFSAVGLVVLTFFLDFPARPVPNDQPAGGQQRAYESDVGHQARAPHEPAALGGLMATPKWIPLSSYRSYSPAEMDRRAKAFCLEMQRRRSVREFASRPVSKETIADCLRAAGSAPSGANMQPWHFVVVGDASVKRRIREAAEAEEYAFYHGRAGTEWLEALSDLGTDCQKPFLEAAPYLIAIFAQTYGVREEGHKVKHYFVRESVGIATGLLIAALHHAGLATLPYTPSRPGFLSRMLGRPENERPFLVLVVGYPAEGVAVPDIGKKTLDEIATFV
jgi:nitroreductase